MPTAPAAGARFAGRFEIDRPLGSGGMGTVYRARDRVTGAWVALKLLRAVPSEADALRFAREAQILASLRHPGIVSYVAHGRDPDGCFLAMEWLEGEDLAARLGRGPLPVPDALQLLQGVAAALAAAHRSGVVHRDLKPTNLFLPGGEIERVKLLDFGVARRLAASQGLTTTGTLLGTPAYMAPEQARGELDVGPAADVFALGCVLYECLTGAPPFEGANLAGILMRILLDEPIPVEERRPGVAGPLSDLLRRMLAKHPDARPADAGALAHALGALGAVPDAPPAPVWARPRGGLFAESEQFLCSVVVAVPPGGGAAQEQATVAAADAALEGERWRSLESGLRGLGTQASFLLDGTVVVTSPPAESAADQVGQAARAALLLKERWPEAEVALATGRGALRGEMAVGEVVERAVALLRGGAGGARVWIDELSAGLLGPRFAVTTAPVGLLLCGEVLHVDEGRPLLGRPTPCVGREVELGTLEGLLSRCAEEPEAHALLVTAPPGAGKSRLRHEFLRRVEQRAEAVTVLLGRGELMGAGAPYGILGDALRRHCGLSGGEALDLQRRRLGERVGGLGPPPERERLTLFLGELCGVAFPGEGSAMLQAAREAPRVMQDRIRRAYLDWLAALCGEAPVLLVLDDLQWGDALSVELLAEALRELQAAPLLVLALGRPEAREAFPALWQGRRAQVMTLRGLSRKACARLARLVLGEGEAAVPEELIDELAIRSAGNALFLEELIRAAAQGRADGQPETVLAMLQARIGRMEPEARRVLRAASLFGQTFWRGGVLSVLGAERDAPAVDEALRRLADVELIEPRASTRLCDQAEYGFRHALMREAAYSLLAAEDLRLGHRAAAAFLTRAGEPDPMILAEHHHRGGDPARAILFYTRAAEQSYDRWDLEQAQLRAGRGVAGGATGTDLGTLRSIQTAICFAASQWPLAHPLATEAIALLPRGGTRWCRTAGYLTAILAFTGDPADLERWIDLFCDVVPAPEAHSAYAEATGQTLSVLSQTRFRAAARRVRPRAARIAHEGAPIDVSARGWLLLGLGGCVRALEPDVWTPVERCQAAAVAFRQAGNLRDLVTAQSYLGQAQGELGAILDGEATLRANVEDARRLLEPYLVVVASLHLAAALAERPEAHLQDEADALAREVLAITDAPAGHRGWAQGVLGRVLLSRGQIEEAAAATRPAVELSVRAPLRQLLMKVLLVRCLLQLGSVEEALALAEDCLAEAGRLGGAGYVEVPLRLAAAEALRAAGRSAPAFEALSESLRQVSLRLGSIPDPAARERYRLGGPEVPRVLALAGAWLGVDSNDFVRDAAATRGEST